MFARRVGIRVHVNHLATKNERRTAMTAKNSLIVNEVLRVHGPDAQRLGLDRLDEDALILGFARWAEGLLKKWLDYAKGALLFVMVPEEPESGMFYIYDRARQTFFMVDLAEAGRHGGHPPRGIVRHDATPSLLRRAAEHPQLTPAPWPP